MALLDSEKDFPGFLPLTSQDSREVCKAGSGRESMTLKSAVVVVSRHHPRTLWIAGMPLNFEFRL